MAFHPPSGKTLLFGGQGSGFSLLSDTWLWDGSVWTQFTGATYPSARFGATVALDQGTGRLVLFGGYNNANYLADTWLWDGVAWTAVTPITSPPGRGQASMADATATQPLTMFGGVGTGNALLGDTWVWVSYLPPLAPLTPTNFAVTGVSASSLTLGWRDLTDYESAYQVVYAPENTTNNTTVPLAASASSWTHSGLSAGQRHNYWVQACKQGACSTLAGTLLGEASPPSPPVALAVQSATTNSITVAWLPGSANSTSYKLVWTPYGSSLYTFVDVPTGATSWTHSGLSAGQSYWYWVQACNALGCSDYAGALGGITAGGTTPAAPTGIGPGNPTDGTIDLRWSDVATNEGEYQVVWTAPPFAAYSFPPALPANSQTYQQSGLAVGETRYFWVRACLGLICSVWSGGIPVSAAAPPVAPANLRTGSVTATNIDVQWDDLASNEDRYELVWTPAATPAYTFVTLAANSTSWTHSGLAGGQSFYYWVRSCRFQTCSTYTGPLQATTSGGTRPLSATAAAAPPPAAPPALTPRAVLPEPPATAPPPPPPNGVGAVGILPATPTRTPVPPPIRPLAP